MSVRIETNIGDFFVDLFTEDAPKTSFNFIKLCKLNYYAFSIFLRCEANFLLQGGDPTNSGKGGDCIWRLLSDSNSRFFPDEIDETKRRHKLRGTLSMAAAGKDKNASQFFFTLADDLDFLDGNCTIFGQLTGFKAQTGVETEEFFDYFNNDVFCDESNRPFQDIFIKKTVVLVDPFPDPEGFEKLLELKVAESSSSSESKPTESFLKQKRIGAEESLEDFNLKGKSEEEIEAERRERTAKGNALVLEIIGDLPSADVKPPENVLFICKLNPITQSDDLKMIFSRFGPIVSCEVIKDRDTQASLGYAFIEFQEKESCEQAYLKMDNVLIDDRRVKVDFSQSVSKLHKQWEAKRRENQKNLESKSHERDDGRKGKVRGDSRYSDRHNRDYRGNRDRDRDRDYGRVRKEEGDYERRRERSRSPLRRY